MAALPGFRAVPAGADVAPRRNAHPRGADSRCWTRLARPAPAFRPARRNRGPRFARRWGFRAGAGDSSGGLRQTAPPGGGRVLPSARVSRVGDAGACWAACLSGLPPRLTPRPRGGGGHGPWPSPRTGRAQRLRGGARQEPWSPPRTQTVPRWCSARAVSPLPRTGRAPPARGGARRGPWPLQHRLPGCRRCLLAGSLRTGGEPIRAGRHGAKGRAPCFAPRGGGTFRAWGPRGGPCFAPPLRRAQASSAPCLRAPMPRPADVSRPGFARCAAPRAGSLAVRNCAACGRSAGRFAIARPATGPEVAAACGCRRAGPGETALSLGGALWRGRLSRPPWVSRAGGGSRMGCPLSPPRAVGPPPGKPCAAWRQPAPSTDSGRAVHPRWALSWRACNLPGHSGSRHPAWILAASRRRRAFRPRRAPPWAVGPSSGLGRRFARGTTSGP